VTEQEARKEIKKIIKKAKIPSECNIRVFNTPHDIFGGKTLNQVLKDNPQNALGSIKRMFT